MQPNQTAVLTEKEKKKTLSFKSKKKSKVLRHILATPYEKYWPLLDQTAEESLGVILEKTLAAAKLPEVKYSMPYSQLAKLSKSERAKLKESVVSDQETKSAKAVRSDLAIGINAVSRALEKNNISVAILANDIDPPVLCHHISDLCVVKRVPLVVMQSLRERTRKSIGFSCIALGIKKEQKYCKEFQKQISQVSSISSIPNRTVIQKEDIDNDECSGNIEPIKIIQDEWDPSRLKEIYLLRKTKNERVFTPKAAGSSTSQLSKNRQFVDYIPLGSSFNEQESVETSSSVEQPDHDLIITPLGTNQTFTTETMEPTVKKRKISSYKPLVVKVVQSNPNKKKKSKR